MKSLNFKKKNLKKILCLFIILFNFHIIFDKLINISYEKSSKIEDSLIIRNSNGNAIQFENITYDEGVIWGTNITFSLNFTYTEDNGITWNPVLDPNAYCNITISETGPTTTDLIKTNMTPLGNGIFFKAINSSRLTAGFGGRIYSIIISGSKTGYNPIKVSDTIFIDTVPTVLKMHDYDDSLIEISEFSQIFGESVNLTVKYYNDTNSPLKGATLSYEWLARDPVLFYEDPINEGYYTATINTTIAGIWGVKSIKVIASLENHSTQTLITSITIGKRPTTLNGEEDLVYISSKVWVEDFHNFTYEYKDLITGNLTGDLDVAIYSWQKMDEYGEPIAGMNGTGILTQNINKSYTLDFKTGLKSIGFYFLYVNLYKQNYEERAALINLEIIPRPTLINGTTSILTISKDIEFRTAYNFTFEINNTLTHSRIGDLDQAFYYWYRTESNGTILEGPSQNIDLVKDLNDLYILDFNSELKSIGFYRIHVEFHKENYSSRYAIINFTISPPINFTISPPLKININSPSPNDEFGIIAPDFELDIIGSFDAIWYTIDNGDTNITISALSGTINQIEWDKRENGTILIKFYANNSNGFVGYALLQVIKFVSEQPSPKVFGYDLMILLGVISIITLTIKKKIFERGLKKES